MRYFLTANMTQSNSLVSITLDIYIKKFPRFYLTHRISIVYIYVGGQRECMVQGGTKQ